MWTVVYVASNEATAHQIKEQLTAEGFLVKVRPAGGSRNYVSAFEVLVPEAEAEEVNELLNQNWSPGRR